MPPLTYVRRLALPLLTLAVLAAPASAGLAELTGRQVWNRSIYRLVKADGSSFRIKALAPLTVLRVEQAGGGEVPWFSVEGKGEARPSPTDVDRIRSWAKAGKLPGPSPWVFDADPRKAHPDWDDPFWKAIEDRTIVHDMTAEMVRMAFGEPDRINVNKRPENVQEHWIYDTGSIWLVEGKVFTWQAP